MYILWPQRLTCYLGMIILFLPTRERRAIERVVLRMANLEASFLEGIFPLMLNSKIK